MKRVLWLFACVLAALTSGVAAQEISASAAFDRREAYIGDTVRLNVSVENTLVAETPEIELEGANVRLLGTRPQSSSFVQIVNGRRTERVDERLVIQYAVTPTREGTLTLQPLDIRVGGETHRTSPATLVVREPVRPVGFDLVASLDRGRIYAGETAVLTLRWYIPDPQRVRGYDFAASSLPPDVEASSLQRTRVRNDQRAVELFGTTFAAELAETTRGGQRVVAFEIRIGVTPMRAGEVAFEDLRVSFDLDEGFRRRVRGLSEAEPITLEVLEPPAAGRPPGYTGLVGEYGVAAAAEPTAVNVGDPITLTVTITGEEPLRGVTEGPDLMADPAFASGFRLSGEGWTFEPTREGERRFRTTIRVTDESIEQIPPIRLPYFDTETGRYEIAETDPIPLDVRAVRVVTAADAVVTSGAPAAVEKLPLDPTAPGIWGIATGEAVLSTTVPAFERDAVVATLAAGLALPPVCFAAAAAWRRARDRRDPEQARRRAALRSALLTLRTDGPARAVERYLAAVFGMSPAAVSGRDCAERLAAFDGDAAEALGELLRVAEASRFGGGSRSDDPLSRAAAADMLRRADRAVRRASR